MSKFHRLLTSNNRCLSDDLGQRIENINRSIAYTDTHITTFYAWLDFAPHTFMPVSDLHMVSCMMQYSTLRLGEGWKQAAKSLNLPYLDVIQIASHDVINPRMTSLKFMNLCNSV